MNQDINIQPPKYKAAMLTIKLQHWLDKIWKILLEKGM